MVSRRPRRRASVPTLVLAWILALGAPGATGAASPTPSPGTPSQPGGGGLTGHWASPANMAGIDLVQDGSHLTGSAINGLHIDGSISGRHATFAFWYGASYASASADRRGHGSLSVSPDGGSATATWQDENPKGKDNGTFTIVRVTSPIGGPGSGGDPGGEPAPEPGDEALPDFEAQLASLAIGAMNGTGDALLAMVDLAEAAEEVALEDAAAAATEQGGSSDPNALAEALRLKQVADDLKATADQSEQTAKFAQAASARANHALWLAREMELASRQDVLAEESAVRQANARVTSAQLQASEANVAVGKAEAAALSAQGIADQAGQALTAATQTRADAEARLAAAGQGASAALRAEVDRAIAAEQAATTAHQTATDQAETLAGAYWKAAAKYQQLALDVKDLSNEAQLYQATLDKAKAQVPLAAAELARAQLDATIKADQASVLTAGAWQDYVNFDKAYWKAWLAMQALPKSSAEPR